MFRGRSIRLVGVLSAVAVVVMTIAFFSHPSFKESPAARSPASKPPSPSPPSGVFPGYLLVADRGNDRLLLLDASGKILWTYPSTKPALPFAYDDDAYFSPDYTKIATNLEAHDQLQVISFPQGQVLWRYGRWNKAGSKPGLLNTPDDPYLLSSGNLQVADLANCRVIQISEKTKKVINEWGRSTNCAHAPPAELAMPDGATPLANGDTLVTEIPGYVDLIAPSGKLLWSVKTPVPYPSDAQLLSNGETLLASYSSPGEVIMMTKKGKVSWRYEKASGPGKLDHPTHAIMLSNGDIAVADEGNDRVVVIDPKTKRIIWSYGHDGKPGKGPGYLDHPGSVDFLPYDVAMANPLIKAAVSGS